VKRAACLLAVALLAAGCGGSSGPLSKRQYEAQMGALGRDFSSDVLNFKATDFKSVAEYFQSLSRHLAGVADRAKAIRPPRDVAGIHARIVDAFEKEAAITGRFAAELHGASVARVKVLLRRFDSSGFRAALAGLDAAGQALAARGYRINSSGGR
jgi:hypothetical protein